MSGAADHFRMPAPAQPGLAILAAVFARIPKGAEGLSCNTSNRSLRYE
jgi:hypothetical protein